MKKILLTILALGATAAVAAQNTQAPAANAVLVSQTRNGNVVTSHYKIPHDKGKHAEFDLHYAVNQSKINPSFSDNTEQISDLKDFMAQAKDTTMHISAIHIVGYASLNGVAKRIGLDEHVITNSSHNVSQKHIYGDAFEAMMGAIYLDQGYDFVNRLLINKIFVNYLKLDSLLESETDFKSRLIEWCQKNHHTIEFSTANDKTYSTAHPFFYSKVLIDGMEVGYGAGESKKEAEQRACYSVSQGFSDNDCTKLMDKLDNIDAKKSEETPVAAPAPAKRTRKPRQKVVKNEESA